MPLTEIAGDTTPSARPGDLGGVIAAYDERDAARVAGWRDRFAR
jgi:hypothetical protein